MAAHSIQQPAVIVITGIMASGKSTVAQLLAERLDKSVHLRGDLFRRMIVNDRKEVEPDASEEELGQLLLRYRLAAQAADTYAGSGFTVVVQDVIVGGVLEDFLSFLQSRPVYLVVLCPTPEAVEQREAQRSKKGYGAWTVDAINRVLHEETPRLGLWLDSSSLTPGETVDKIMSGIGEAKIR